MEYIFLEVGKVGGEKNIFGQRPLDNCFYQTEKNIIRLKLKKKCFCFIQEAEATFTGLNEKNRIRLTGHQGNTKNLIT